MERLLVVCLLGLLPACSATVSNKANAPAPTGAFGPTDSSRDYQAPWSVRQTKLADNRWLISMRKRMFTMGGDGEPIALLHLQAQKLAGEQGYNEYLILSFTEGVQSDMPIAYRWARGEILLRDATPPMPRS